MKWTQEDSRVWVESPEGRFYFDLPADYRLEDTHPDLLRLAEILLFVDWHPELAEYRPTRWRGVEHGRVGMAYSGGYDSTAALAILPTGKVVTMFHQRDGFPLNAQSHDCPLSVIACNAPGTIIVPSNFEAARKAHGLHAGFQSDLTRRDIGLAGLSPLTALVLMADYLNLGYLALGIQAQTLFITYDGKQYRDFGASEDWRDWKEIFERFGLPLFMPVCALTEVGTAEIVRQTQYAAEACVRGRGGPCGECFKCYRKSALAGRQMPVFEQTAAVLEKNRHNVLSCLIYAHQHCGVVVPGMERYAEVDTTWMGGYYEPALGLMPCEWRERMRGAYEVFGLRPMKAGAFEGFALS